MKKVYGLIGFPLTHSFSQKYFTEKFRKENIDAEYLNFEIGDIGDIMEVVAEYPELQGFNVTIPYKELILPYLDWKSPEVEAIGAANVVKIERHDAGNMIFKGYNTDCYGFMNSLFPLSNAKEKRALILGTGGASKAVEYILKEMGYQTVKVSRTPKHQELGYEDLKGVINDYFLIVNTTPLGTYPIIDSCPDLPYKELNAAHLAFDLVYNPSVTKFMSQCAERGCAVKNGYEMLVLQAEYSWRIWNS